MIKNFIYLDEDKMYSLSSQIFEGVTEYILDEKSTESEETESQKGPLASGRILSDILKRVGRTTEKKFLNDFSYSLFEKNCLKIKKSLRSTKTASLKRLAENSRKYRSSKYMQKLSLMTSER